MSTFQQKHGRPKPPRICGGLERDLYEIGRPQVLTIFKDHGSPLWVVCIQGENLVFPTHAEAITWAQKHARNRKKSGGEISGA